MSYSLTPIPNNDTYSIVKSNYFFIRKLKKEKDKIKEKQAAFETELTDFKRFEKDEDENLKKIMLSLWI